MSEYKGIHGGKIQNFTTNPDNPIEGQVWYNETDGNWKVSSISTVGAWSTGGDLNTARSKAMGVAESSTSALVTGGSTPPTTTNTELYDGSTWTEVNDLNTARYQSVASGTQTAAISAGGRTPVAPSGTTINESWNGTSWTEVNDLNTARVEIGGSGAGSSTSALNTGGSTSPPTNKIANNESWNGTSWTEVGDLNTARNQSASVGVDNTSALCFGGQNPSTYVANTESWNGTSWTELNDLGTARYALAGAGTSTDALGFGGYQYLINPSSPHAVALTEAWNGSSWSETSDLNRKISSNTGNGTGASAITIGGIDTPTVTSNTEEWIGAGASVTETITTS
jgi:hypothetical protein